MGMRRWLLQGPMFVLLGLAVAAPVHGAGAPAPVKADSEGRLRRDITFLASDGCEGRGPTTQGINRAAEYVAAEFRKAGLKPAGKDGYFQPFTIPASVLLEPARLDLTGPLGQNITLHQGRQFHPMGLGHAGQATAPVVFAGYGITSTVKAMPYDDYAGLDVEDKVVVVLRGAPRGPTTPLWQFAPFLRKLETAYKHGAAAVLIVNDENMARPGDPLIDFNFTALERLPGKLPAFHVKRAVLADMLQSSAALELTNLERDLERDLKPHSLPLKGWTISLRVKMRHDKITLKNVVGVLEGSGPLAKETVVIGAHYDHLGYGLQGQSRANLRIKAIHHGADDNASGTTALMELARRFGAMHNRVGRRLVFIAFSGEELALLGSAHYCKAPLFPLDKTTAMFNLDMVGRLRPDKKTGKDKLLVEGNGTGNSFDHLLDALNRKHDFNLVRSKALLPNSDHFSFYKKKVPVLFFWTGLHADYHMPSDTADKINVPGMRRVVEITQDVLAELTTMKRPTYQEVQLAGRGSYSNGPRLGIVPGYGGGSDGLVVDGVVANGPAERAGLRKDDRIVAIDGKPVKEITTYMKAMSGQQKGTTIPVEIIRDGKKKTVKVKLD